MKTTRIAAIAAGVVAGTGALFFAGYRVFIPGSRSVGEGQYKVRTKKHPVQAGEHTLYGELQSPGGGEGPWPTVICCHSMGSNYRLCREAIATSLTKSGYQTYCFDFYGGSKRGRSGGTTEEMSLFTEQEDLRAVIDELLTLPEVDPENVFLLGQSLGGAVAAITAPEYGDRIRGLILNFPAFNIIDESYRQFPGAGSIPEKMKVFGNTLSKEFHEKLRNFDIFETIAGYTGPVLITHGDKDTIVPLRYSELAERVYENGELTVYPGEFHGYSAAGKRKATASAYEFLEKIREGER